MLEEDAPLLDGFDLGFTATAPGNELLRFGCGIKTFPRSDCLFPVTGGA